MVRTMGEYQHMTDTSANDIPTPAHRRFAVPAMYRRHCGRRALLRFRVELLLEALHAYDRYRRIDFSRVQRMVFVCHGNICRSPFAEAVANKLGMASQSVGLAASGNCKANETAISTARALGYEMTEHVSKHAASEPVSQGDLVVCMEVGQASAAGRVYARSAPQVALLGLFAKQPYPSILDPYGRPDEFFRDCFERIESAVTTLVELANGNA